MTHDYERHGVTTLFAALDVLEGKVTGQCMKRHRHQEFIRFLNVIEARAPKKKTIHIIVDNYATYKHLDVMLWLEKHRRFVFHFTPTSDCWLNAIEGFLPSLQRSISSAAFSDPCGNSKMPSTASSTTSMQTQNPWTKDPNKIIAAVNGGTKC
jgi:DDE superfamily endonuclease